MSLQVLEESAAAVSSARASKVNFVLVWVQKSDEAEIKRAFDHAQPVRKLSTGK